MSSSPEHVPLFGSSLRDSLGRLRSSATLETDSTARVEDFLGPPQAADEVGWIAQYRLRRRLGEGGMGCVYEAEDVRLQRRVALKLLLPVHADHPQARERFLREARAMAQLTHPHIVTVYDIGLAPAADGRRDLPYLAMQLLQGETLEACVVRRGALPQAEAVRIGRETAEGLAAAHAQGFIHRDIKPSNLWLESPDGSVKILDFGLAHNELGGGHLSRTGQIVGTPAFMAPEQARGDKVDARADLFSLGCVLYTILAGELPFDAPSVLGVLTRLATYDPPPLLDRLPGMVPALSQLVQELLAKDPAARPASAQVVVERLREIGKRAALASSLAAPTQDLRQSATPSSIPLPTPAPPAQPPSRRSLLLAGAGAVAGVLGLGAVAWWWNRRGAGTLAGGPPIRVGILHSQTGTMSGSEVPVLEMTQLALEEINARGGLLGRPVEWVLGDGGSNERLFAREAERLLGAERATVLFGCWTSASRKAVKEVVEARERLLFYPVQYEGLEQSPWIVYTGAAPNQQLLPAADWCIRQKQKRTFLLVGSDYIFPRAANTLLRHRIAEHLGAAAVLGEEYAALGNSDVGNVMAAVKRTRPEVILNSINGDSNVAFFRALHRAGLGPRDVLVMSFSLDEQSLRGLDPATVAGTYTAWNYFSSLAGPANAAFKAAYARRWGAHKVVTDPMEAAWLSVHFWARAVEECRLPEDAHAVRRSLADLGVDAPEGKGVRIDTDTQHTWKYFRVGMVGPAAEIEVVHSDDAPTQPVPYPHYRKPAEWQAWQEELYRRWGDRWSAPG